MSRTIKTGLDYFTFDVDFFDDEKIQFLAAKFEEYGELIAVKLLTRIYRNGYYLNWGEDEAILFAKKAGPNIKPDLVNEIVIELIKRDFFDKKLFDDFGILTSRGIQKRYFKAVERRKKIDVFSEYLLINVNINSLNDNINVINVDRNTQSKVKKRKGKESKEKKNNIKRKFGKYEHVKLTEEEYKKLSEKWGEKRLKYMIEVLDNGIEMKGYSYKNHYLALIKWEKKDKEFSANKSRSFRDFSKPEGFYNV